MFHFIYRCFLNNYEVSFLLIFAFKKVKLIEFIDLIMHNSQLASQGKIFKYSI